MTRKPYDVIASHKVVIYDRGDKVVDRFTIFPYAFTRDTTQRRVYLGCSEGGIAFSQWGELTQPRGSYLGKRVTLDELSPATRNHIRSRLEDSP